MEEVIPKLVGPRLILRKPELEDSSVIFSEYACDAEVTRYLTWTPHKCIETVDEFVRALIEKNRSGDEFAWAIARPEDNRLIGMISARFRGHTADLGYVLARNHWKNGYMTEAVTFVSDWFLARPGFFRVSAVCDVENPASARVLQKSGFEREGILRRYMLHPNVSSEPRDCLLFARVN